MASGPDSVQTIELASGLRVLLLSSLNPISLSTFAAKVTDTISTIEDILAYPGGLLRLVTGDGSDMSSKRAARMSVMFDKYTEDRSKIVKGAVEAKNEVQRQDAF